MKKCTFKKLLGIGLICLTILGVAIIYVFDPFIEQVQRYPSYLGMETGYLSINPDTILDSIDNGKSNVFETELSTPQSPIFQKDFSWQQSDYTRIIYSLNDFVWKDSLDDWNLYSMKFINDCDDNLGGFEYGEFYYFKTILHRSGRINYAGRGFEVTPQYGDVAWGSGPNYPHPIPGWKSVKLNKIKVFAEDALRIADENGGREARLSVQNECRIHLNQWGDTGWELYIFRNDGGGDVFSVEINPMSGTIK